MLFTERDSEGEASGNQVTLMTLHSAKGLEFPYVFLVGMADGVFPNQRTLDEAGVDEERRLCYVGITRAQRELTFSMGTFQKRYGEVIKREPSRFLLEIDPELFSTPVVGEASLVQKKQQREQSRSDFFLQLQQMKAN
jgi:superfamily I DNA/RNA helicase